MKQIILSLLLFLVSIASTYGQNKSYVTVYCPLNSSSLMIKLSGDIPSNMQTDYCYYDFGYTRVVNNYYLVGHVLNLLAENGFTVEKSNSWSNGQTDFTMYLCSRNSTSGTSTYAREVKEQDNADVKEVARYNLQGMPVSKAEKGVQVVVYSNYTTKTVVVE